MRCFPQLYTCTSTLWSLKLSLPQHLPIVEAIHRHLVKFSLPVHIVYTNPSSRRCPKESLDHCLQNDEPPCFMIPRSEFRPPSSPPSISVLYLNPQRPSLLSILSTQPLGLSSPFPHKQKRPRYRGQQSNLICVARWEPRLC